MPDFNQVIHTDIQIRSEVFQIITWFMNHNQECYLECRPIPILTVVTQHRVVRCVLCRIKLDQTSHIETMPRYTLNQTGIFLKT